LEVGRTELSGQFGRKELIAQQGQRADFTRFRDNRLHVAVGGENVVDPR
jgi:hypothetical protein